MNHRQFSAHMLLVLMLAMLAPACAGVQDLQSEFVTGKPALSKATLKEAKMQDDALEASMIQALKDAKWKEEVRGVTITAAEWTAHRDPVHGQITHRTIPADVVAHLEGNSYCRLFSLSFKQPFDGTSYGTTALNGTGDSVKVDCEQAISTDNKAE